LELHLVLVVDGDTDRSYTYTDIKNGSAAFGKGLKHLFNWQKGDVLGFFTPNCIDTPIVTYGLHWAGGVASPANPTYTVDELARQLIDSNSKALVTQKPFLAAAVKAAQKAQIPLERVILMGDGRDETGKHRHWTDITAQEAWLKPKRTAVDPTKDLAYLVYSSVSNSIASEMPQKQSS
jgi:acyl-CoA synthetase (AMP-forming)/AMP-acid ligase II